MAEKKTLQDILDERDMRGAQLARKLGVDRAAVSAWCLGKTRPSMPLVPKIAKILDLTVEEVVGLFVEV